MTEKHEMSDVSRRQGNSLLLCGLGAAAFGVFTYSTLPRLAVAANEASVLLTLRWLVGSISISGLVVAFFGWVMLPSVKTEK